MNYRDLVKRLFDLCAAILGLGLLLLPMALVACAIKLSSSGPIIFWSKRVGKNNIIFNMPKFRTMNISTPNVASHLLLDVDYHLTPIGSILRKLSIDELPQLLSVLSGEMSIVGPRPALYNQEDLILKRTAGGVDRLLPGITGWAQINGRDELNINEKVNLDLTYLHKRSFWLDLKIIFLTVLKVFKREGISH